MRQVFERVDEQGAMGGEEAVEEGERRLGWFTKKVSGECGVVFFFSWGEGGGEGRASRLTNAHGGGAPRQWISGNPHPPRGEGRCVLETCGTMVPSLAHLAIGLGFSALGPRPRRLDDGRTAELPGWAVSLTPQTIPALLRSAVSRQNTLIVIPSYFDFVRVTNYLRKADSVSYVAISE